MRHEEDVEPLFTIQVWQLLVIVGGLLAVAAHVLVGLPVPAFDGGYWKFRLGMKALEIGGGVVVLALLLFAKHRHGAGEDDDA